MVIVVDASVAIAWCLRDGEGTDEVDSLGVRSVCS